MVFIPSGTEEASGNFRRNLRSNPILFRTESSQTHWLLWANRSGPTIMAFPSLLFRGYVWNPEGLSWKAACVDMTQVTQPVGRVTQWAPCLLQTEIQENEKRNVVGIQFLGFLPLQEELVASSPQLSPKTIEALGVFEARVVGKRLKDRMGYNANNPSPVLFWGAWLLDP